MSKFLRTKPFKAVEAYRARQPFHVFSSRNKKGNKPHPLIFARRESILNMFWEHRTIEEIACELKLAIDTVRDHIKRARKNGDRRAARKTGQKRIMQAEARRKQIIELAKYDYSPQEIAGMVNCHVRLVQMRLKEAGNG